MRSILQRKHSSSPTAATNPPACNTVATLGVGAVADVSGSGMVVPRHRTMAVDFWIGGGDRWWIPESEATVRQRRVEGLPVVETRMRVGDADVVLTAWADEPGDGRGRVVVSVGTETEVPVVLAVVVRPSTIAGHGRVERLRVVDELIVADQLPIVRLPRAPADVRIGSKQLGGLATRLPDATPPISGETSVTCSAGRAEIAAMIPLTPGVEQIIEIVDGREVPTVPPAPLERIVAGWRTHLAEAATISLPGWPEHLPVSLVSGLLGSVAHRPISGSPAADAAIAVALSGSGLGWASAQVVDDLLDAVEDGRIPRSEWFLVAAACGRLASLTNEHDLLAKRADTVVAIVCQSLAARCSTAQRLDLEMAIRYAAGERAAADAAEISPHAAQPEDLHSLAHMGIDLAPPEWEMIVADDTRSAEAIGSRMALGARSGIDYDAVVDVRALAGATWRWADSSSGDSPLARAALLNGLRAMAVHETPLGLDLAPGFGRSWLGVPVDVERLPTRVGRLSYALRWHGERPALLWELADVPVGADVRLSVSRIDTTFETTQLAGEALLHAPSFSGEE